jgi:hypothetical protein
MGEIKHREEIKERQKSEIMGGKDRHTTLCIERLGDIGVTLWAKSDRPRVARMYT